MEEKNIIRKRILKIRKEMNEETVHYLSEFICEKICNTNSYKNSKNICLYFSVNNEVNLKYIIPEAEASEKKIYFPKVTGKTMDFYLYDKSAGFSKGSFGIMEPVSDIRLIPDDKTLIIMPGAVFSKERDRIGYGGGYYDRYLSCFPVCKTIAACYDFQIVDKLASEPHDIKPEIIISEKQSVFY